MQHVHVIGELHRESCLREKQVQQAQREILCEIARNMANGSLQDKMYIVKTRETGSETLHKVGKQEF